MIPVELQARLLAAWDEMPAELRSRPATADEIAALERDLGPLPDDLRWFLACLGGGVVGAEWIDDAPRLRATHAKFNAERDFWSLTDGFVIGWDGAGNPIVIDRTTSAVVTEDHTFGGIHELILIACQGCLFQWRLSGRRTGVGRVPRLHPRLTKARAPPGLSE